MVIPIGSKSEPEWADLMRRAACGDHSALAAFYDATSQLVFGLALRILGDRDAAEDAVVEVYSQVWREANGYDPQRGTPYTWLLTLTRSRAIDMLRARKREPVNDPLDAATEVESSAPTPEDVSVAAQRHRMVRRALDGLSMEQREAIELAYFRGLSHSEIALQLGQPLGTIKTRIRLGMMRMREQLAHLAPPAIAEGMS